MKPYRALVLVALLSAGASSKSPGQTPSDLFQQGVRAYRRAEFDAAAALFRRSNELSARDSASFADRLQLLEYLGAADMYRGSRDSAVAVFARVLQQSPRHRLDDIIFPPEVSTLLDEVRRNVKLVGLEAARDTLVRAGGRWNARILATSFHLLSAVVLSDEGGVVRELYYGPIEDTLQLSWDARDSLGRVVGSGDYTLSLTSTTRGNTVRALRVPLVLTIRQSDTLSHPVPLQDSLLLPEQTRGSLGPRSLLAGLALGAAAVVLPPVLAEGMKPSAGRFAVGAAVSVAGIVGFVLHRPGQPLTANIASNRARRNEWRARVDSVARENAVRRANVGIGFRTGTGTATGSGIP